MRPALLRRSLTSLTARSNRAAGLYAGAPTALAALGQNVRAAGRPIAHAAAISLRTSRRVKVPVFKFASRQNDLGAATIANIGQVRSSAHYHPLISRLSKLGLSERIGGIQYSYVHEGRARHQCVLRGKICGLLCLLRKYDREETAANLHTCELSESIVRTPVVSRQKTVVTP